VITAGKYSAWFSTPVGEGAGTVVLNADGTLSGGDTTFSYAGHWEQIGERFRAVYTAKRMSPGPPGVFGMDELDIVVTGRSDDGVTASCTGFAKQSPGLKLEVKIVRLEDVDHTPIR
jgi:hypothetical protein